MACLISDLTEKLNDVVFEIFFSRGINHSQNHRLPLRVLLNSFRWSPSESRSISVGNSISFHLLPLKYLLLRIRSAYLNKELNKVMDLGDLNKVWEIKALKKKPKEDEARKILEKIAKQVQPIMKKHKWRVKLLTEFCPGNPALLGVNVGGGVQVKLRLRRPNRDLDFYPYDQVLDTMLHELCHNAHGPHNSSFYKLWDDLRKECEELMTRGITGTGEGFDLPGKHLGGFSRQPPLSSIRQVALTAAEKRARVGSLLPHGPKRLGGDNDIMAALSPVQAAAMAAERRLQDDMWCGCESFGGSGEEKSSSDIPQTVGSRAAPSANNSKQWEKNLV